MQDIVLVEEDAFGCDLDDASASVGRRRGSLSLRAHYSVVDRPAFLRYPLGVLDYIQEGALFCI